MNALLTALTLLEVLLFVGVLAGYLITIQRILRTINQTLAKLAMGVRAIETQTAPVGGGLSRINDRLGMLTHALDQLADRAGATRR